MAEFDIIKEEKKVEEYTLQDLTESLDVHSLGMLVAYRAFGEDITTLKEDLFSNHPLDPTDRLEAELVAKIEDMFEVEGLATPDCMMMQAFGRKGGFIPKKKEWEYAMVLGINEFQVISHSRKDHVVFAGEMSPLFHIEEGDIPLVLPNKTQVKLEKGKGTIKKRHFLGVIVWAFWENNPVMEQAPNAQTDELARAMSMLQDPEIKKQMEELDEAIKKEAEEEASSGTPSISEPLIL